MTNDLETRLRADLPRLADHLVEGGTEMGSSPPGIDDRRSRRHPVRRWWVAAAAVVVVVIGSVALLSRGEDVPVDTTEQLTTITTVPAPAFVVTDEPVGITISIYSGRPDPVFNPTVDEQVRLIDLLNRLEAPLDSTGPALSQLGFRGFAITGLGPAGSSGDRYHIEVWGPSVAISGSGEDRGTILRGDPSGALFELLLAMTESHRDEVAPHDETFVDSLRAAAPR